MFNQQQVTERDRLFVRTYKRSVPMDVANERMTKRVDGAYPLQPMANQMIRQAPFETPSPEQVRPVPSRFLKRDRPHLTV